MSNIVRFIWIMLALVVSAPSMALGGSPKPVSWGAPIVIPAAARPGEIVTIELPASIAPGWHFYSVLPASKTGVNLPTTVVVRGNGLSAVGANLESAPLKKFDDGFQAKIAYHELSAWVGAQARVDPSVKPGSTIRFIATVLYQACNSKYCNPPDAYSTAANLTVEPGAPRAKYAAPTAVLAPPISASKSSVSDTGLFGFMAAAFLAGLLALLTPCVFPLIPVTFGYFTKEAAGNSKRLTLLACVYVGGIILSFVALGLIATLVLGAAGPNKVASNPYLNIGFGILFVILAFAFFETFNFTLPSSMQSLAASWRRRGGVVGVLLMGLAFVFTAFTCTAPFIASILAAAASTSFSGDYARPLLGMALFALALSAPFFLIAFFPKLLTRLPKSGEWMSTMKAVLGFVELAYAILYFSKADLVLQAHIITRSVIFGLWASICICGALYLIGALKVNALAGGEAKIGAGRWLGAGIFALTAFYCFYAISGRPIDPNLAAFVPEAEYGAQSGSQSAPGDVVWLDDFDKAVALAKQENRPIFINFTGYTCTNCRWMEQNIFTKPPVRALFPKLVTVRLYTDGGIDADKNAALQIKLGKANAQPLYALVTPDGVVLDTHIGIEKDPAAFARFIDEAFRAPTSSVSAAPSANDEWASYSDERYAEALKAGKPIVIDFTASWCIVCHSIERTVFSQPDVRGQLGKFTTLKADLTTFDSPESVKIEKKFGVAKLPTVVILNPSGKEFAKSRVTGILSAKDFLAHLNSASTNQRARWTLIALR